MALSSSSTFLDGGGEMGALMRAHDWAPTPLGPVEGWPETLRSTLGLCLDSAFPIAIYWGPQLALLYNDAWRPILGGKHPWGLGRPAREVWPEIWDAIDPVFTQVLGTGKGVFNHDSLLAMNRSGYVEECYFDYTFNPVRVGREVVGIFNVVIETTYRVIAERRSRVLRDFAANVAEARSIDDVMTLAANNLAQNAIDVPFALLYRIASDGRTAALARAVGLEAGTAAAPLHIALDDPTAWPLGKAMKTGEAQRVPDLARRFGQLPGGPWPEPARDALVLPLTTAGQAVPAALLVAGVSPRRELDLEYTAFFESLSSHMAAAIASAGAFQAERQRAETLAELDQAKTAFFSNVSHEFRTPLTLMLGPLEEMLSQPEGGVSPENRALLAVVQRNGQRLLKLVNTLLDFARIEAGRAEASYEAVDLASLTADLASNFRAACERAGLRLEVRCPPLGEAAWVDRDMWEKIVLNLVSNAFKFTLEGEIEVGVKEAGGEFVLTVRDTGSGIPEAELPRMFERFHRVEGARGRSHEGSGIGLALVHELVRLHGGRIAVETRLGKGSVFTVSIPAGNSHLPAQQLRAVRARAPTALRADAYVDEALGWLPQAERQPEASASKDAQHVLLADDNADLREYVRRLLAESYQVEAVADGEAALAAARARRPDLVISDVMMPRLDGFGLIRELRADARLREVPVILLSARAGEEARIEGLGKGADEYLVKPFSARELLVRVGALLQTAGIRREAEAALRESDRRKDEFIATLSHELRNPLAPLRTALELLRISGTGGEEMVPIRDMMERQVNQLVRLVDDLLEISRISRGAFELRRERLDLRAVLANARETSDPHLKAAGHELAMSVPEEPVWVQGDPVRLAQILSNLINNAAKYTAARGRVAVELLPRNGAAEICVRDNGIGIAPEALPRLFEMFSRGEHADGRSQGGLGIGLAISRRLAEMHGGTLEAASDGPGKGSEFTLRLPLAADDIAPQGEKQRAETAVPQQRVLVVDDNVDAAHSMGMVLKFLGADVHIANDGPQALEAFQRYAPAVVLLDIGMPGMDGYEVARRIRTSQSGRRTAIVALTGWGKDEDRRRSRDAGFDHHITKPADIDALRSLLASL